MQSELKIINTAHYDEAANTLHIKWPKAGRENCLSRSMSGKVWTAGVRWHSRCPYQADTNSAATRSGASSMTVFPPSNLPASTVFCQLCIRHSSDWHSSVRSGLFCSVRREKQRFHYKGSFKWKVSLTTTREELGSVAHIVPPV